jgi:metal-dependent amidase/aminoacylase/carboxypeptidase family protein
VVSIGAIHGGQAENVIPERVEMNGTLRYARKEVREQIHVEIRRAFELTRVLGGDYELRFEIGTPPMINHTAPSELIARVARDLLGEDSLHPGEKNLGAEDFGCFMELAPGAMYSLGTGNESLHRHIHAPDFDIDEGCLPVGTAILAEAALRFLRNEN